MKMIKLRGQCSLYQEFTTKKGKSYYFNYKTNESIWEKPKCLAELEGWINFTETQ